MSYITKISKFSTTGIKLAWHWTQNLVGWVGLLVAAFTLYLQTAGKEHNLNIVASSIDPAGTEITFGIIYQNTGDFTEIITDASASLSSSKDPNVSWADNLEDCFNPIVIKPGETIHKYYTARLPYYGLNKESAKNGNIESNLTILFSALMPNAKTQSFGLFIGEIQHRAAEGTFSNLDIRHNVLKVKFDNAPAGAFSLSLPDNVGSANCVKKRQ